MTVAVSRREARSRGNAVDLKRRIKRSMRSFGLDIRRIGPGRFPDYSPIRDQSWAAQRFEPAADVVHQEEIPIAQLDDIFGRFRDRTVFSGSARWPTMPECLRLASPPARSRSCK